MILLIRSGPFTLRNKVLMNQLRSTVACQSLVGLRLNGSMSWVGLLMYRNYHERRRFRFWTCPARLSLPAIPMSGNFQM